MARTKEFDSEAVLEDAMRTFWSAGFAGASIQDLEAATGLGRGSLYNAFGDKDALMLAALERYRQRSAARVAQALASSDPAEAVRRFLRIHLDRMADPDNPPGCLMAATLLECAGRGDAIERKAVDHLHTSERALYEMFARAQKAGRLPAAQDPRALARFYVGATRGMALVHRATQDLTMVQDIAAVALDVLRRPSPEAAGGKRNRR